MKEVKISNLTNIGLYSLSRVDWDGDRDSHCSKKKRTKEPHQSYIYSLSETRHSHSKVIVIHRLLLNSDDPLLIPHACLMQISNSDDPLIITHACLIQTIFSRKIDF